MPTKDNNLPLSSARLDDMQAKKYSAVDLENIHSVVVEKLTKEKKFFIPRHDKEKSVRYTGFYEKLSDYLCEKSIDPELYFGVLTLHFIKNRNYYEENSIPCLASTAPLVASDKAIKIFFAYSKFIEKDGVDAKKYVESHYIKIRQEDMKLSRLLTNRKGVQYVKELIIGEIVQGEKQVKIIQDRRNLDRWDALVFCIDFNMVSDIFVLACKEYRTRGNEILTYRWKLEDVIKDQSPFKVKFKQLIRDISVMYYEQGIQEIPPLPKKHKGKQAKTLYEDIN